MTRSMLLAFVFISLLFVFGCNRGARKPDGLPKLYPVTIRLEQEGRPLAGAEVVLRSEVSGNWSCGGNTDQSGVVKIHTHGQFSGAPAGRHKIIVTKTKFLAPKGSVDFSQAKSLGELREMEEEAARNQSKTDFGATVYHVERKYSDPETTPLEIEVASGKNSFKLDVGPVVEIVKKHTTPTGGF